MKTVEYAHIYTDQKFGVQHERSIEELHKIENELGRKAVTRVVMIDDYSPEGEQDFDYQEFMGNLEALDAKPDVVLHESALIPLVYEALTKMGGRERKSMERYIQKKDKIPCSMFIAAMYLYRMGELETDPVTLYGNPREMISDDQATVLPESFVTPETKATELIKATGAEDIVERHYFGYEEPEYSDWKYFDTQEYVERNYLRGMLDEDKEIIEFTIGQLKELGEERGELAKRAADIGCGPNLYPAMLLTPYLDNRGSVDMIDYLPQNTEYVKRTLAKQAKQNSATGDWKEFESFALQRNDDISLAKLSKIANVKEGSIFNLPKDEYDIITSSFVADSITDDKEKFEIAVASMMASLKKGGVFVLANMLGSKQYFAGEREYFPSVDLSPDYIDELYGKYGDVKSRIIAHGDTGVRDGYSGMMITVGKKF